MSWYLAFAVVEWTIRLVMLPIVTSRRKPNAAMAWLLLIFFIPWLGLILFLSFGTLHLPRLRRKRIGDIFAKIEAEAQRFRSDPNIVRPDLGPKLDSTVQVAQRLGKFPILGGNEAIFLTDTEEVIDRLEADIDAACNHVHLLFYIFWNDATGNRVIDALGAPSSAG